MSSVVDTINGVEFRWNSEGTVTVNGLPVSRAKWEERRAACVKAENPRGAMHRAILADIEYASKAHCLWFQYGEG